MADEAQTQDANTDAQAESSDAASQEGLEENTPTEANSAPPETKPEVKETKEDDAKIPYGRFKEVIEEKNELRKRLDSLESKFNTQEASKRPSAIDSAVQKLVKRGMDEESATALVEAQFEIASSAVNDRVAPIEQHSVEAEVKAWTREFSTSHKDYAELEPVMYSIFQSLPAQTQQTVASSKEGLELLYSHAKVQKMQDEIDKNYKKGVSDGYKNKASKNSVSSESGSAVKGGLPTLEDIGKMSLQEYEKHRDVILKNQSKY